MANAVANESAGKQQAIAEHNADRKYLRDLIDNGQNEHTTSYKEAWSNAAAWLKQGKSSLFALTKTHDSAARATANRKTGMNAVFGRKDAVSMTGNFAARKSYSDTLTAKDNVYFVRPDWGGFQVGKDIAVNEPRKRGKDSIRSVIVHETQHAADHHGSDDFSRYQTELRAYWLGRTYSGKSDRDGSAQSGLVAGSGATRTTLDGFKNARQQAIFAHLYNSPSYAYAVTLWKSAASRQKVLAYSRPTGMNLVNSPRIENLFQEMGRSAPRLSKLREYLGALTASDKTALQSPGMKATWQNLLNKPKITAQMRQAFEAVVGDMTSSAAVGALFAELNKSKPDKKRVNALSMRLTRQDKQRISSPAMRERWIALANEKLKGNDREIFRQNVGL